MKTALSGQVASGFLAAGKILLVFAWLVAVGSGIALISGERSSITGWMLLAVTGIVLLLTTHLWVRILPGLLAVGVVGGLFMVVTGHALNDSATPVSVLDSVLVISFAAAATILSSTYTQRTLSWVDRLLLLGFVACFLLGGMGRGNLALWGAGLTLLLMGWAWASRVTNQR